MKIAYIKEQHPTNGTIYRQRLTVTPSEFEQINEKLKDFYTATENDTRRQGFANSQQVLILCHCKPLDENDTPTKNKYFLSLTQTHFIKLFFTPARLKYYNTVLYVKNYNKKAVFTPLTCKGGKP